MRYNKLCLFQKFFTLKIKRINYAFILKILKLELRDTYKHLRYISTEIYKIYKVISNMLPVIIKSAFFSRQERYMNMLWYSEKIRIDQKIQSLILKADKQFKHDIKSITYFLRTLGVPKNNITFDENFGINKISPNQIVASAPSDKIYSLVRVRATLWI